MWIGYFDEGVYGNFGWGGRGREPIGAPGIVRFSTTLKQAWAYPGGSSAPPVSDVYALNVTDEAVWSCYYTDLPVVRIAGDRVTVWRNEVQGASAIVAGATTVALVGGYPGDRDRVVVGDLTDDAFVPRRSLRLRLPDGDELPGGLGLVARGEELHVIGERRWWKVSLEQLLEG